MYLGEILGSWVMASFLVWTMNSDALIFGSSNEGQCSDELGPETYALAAIVLFKIVLCLVASYWMCCSQNILDRNTEQRRFMLRRLQVHLIIVKHRVINALLILCDILTLASVFLCIPMRPDATTACGGLYRLFLRILFYYQMIVTVRVPIFICLFMCGGRLWIWCKRSCSCLNTVEGEQTAKFDVFEA